MKIECEINLSSTENDQIKKILGVKSNGNLEALLGKYATAALEEYVKMILGQKVFTRGSDFREYRLLLLIKHVFNNKIPNEQKICELFQTTDTQSRILLRSILSKYQYELNEAIDQSLKNVLINAHEAQGSNDYFIDIDNKNIIDFLNRIQLTIDGNLPPITLKRNTISTYIIKPSSKKKLWEFFSL
jgi:hypothetical protein